MSHSSIQITVNLYGHLIPAVNTQAVDRLDTPALQSDSAAPAPPAATFAGPVSSDQLTAQEVMTVGIWVDDGFREKPQNYYLSIKNLAENVAIRCSHNIAGRIIQEMDMEKHQPVCSASDLNGRSHRKQRLD